MKSQQILNFFVFFVKLTRKKRKQQKDENSEKLRDQGGEEIGWITWKGVVESGKNVGMEPGLKKIQKGVGNKRETFFFVFAPFAKNFRKYIRPGQSQNFSQISAIFLLAKNRYYYLFLETSGSRHSFLEEMWLVLAPTVTWNHRIEEGAPWRVMRCIPKKWNLKNHWDDCNHGFWEEEWVFCKRLPVTECSLPLSFLSKNLYCKPSCEIMN